jgi:outer membrane protein OmpA-like peptidoglycan-associated protein
MSQSFLRLPLLAAVIAAVTLPRAATAQEAQGFAVSRFEPSERGSEWFANESLDLRGTPRVMLGAVGDYSYRSLSIYAPDGTTRQSPVRNLFFAHLGGSFVFGDRYRLAVNMPLQVFADGHGGRIGTAYYPSPPNEQGIGDLRLGADVRVFGRQGEVITGAVGLQVWLPTGDRAQYSSDGEVRIRPRAMVAGEIGSFVYAAQVNVAYRGREDNVGGGALGSEIGFSGSAGLRALDGKLVFGPELYGSTVFDDAFAKRTTPVEGILGMHYLDRAGVRIGAGLGTGLTRGFGSPEVRALLSLEWVSSLHEDTDGDGIEDKDDACPTQPGVKTGDPRTNGCPAALPPKDRDLDGIVDSDDACPDVAGVKSTDPKTNGCPPDRDHDGIEDAKDACPDVAGVGSTDPAKNGCPADTDGDGVLDVDDACPTEPGVKTADPKTNGCPDPDRDKDTVPNAQDACPDEPGKPDPDPKKNGCPAAFVSAGQIRILNQVKFKTGSADIEKGKESQDVLEAVLEVLKGHPDIKKVRVEGHTDDRGAAAMNKKLSADRAAAVVKWLVGHGIDKSRLASEGFGPERPLDNNTTEEGRRQNRRVEFHIEN